MPSPLVFWRGMRGAGRSGGPEKVVHTFFEKKIPFTTFQTGGNILEYTEYDPSITKVEEIQWRN